MFDWDRERRAAKRDHRAWYRELQKQTFWEIQELIVGANALSDQLHLAYVAYVKNPNPEKGGFRWKYGRLIEVRERLQVLRHRLTSAELRSLLQHFITALTEEVGKPGRAEADEMNTSKGRLAKAFHQQARIELESYS